MNALATLAVLGIWSASPPQATFESIAVLKSAAQVELTPAQARSLAKLGNSIQLHLARRDRELAAYLDSEKVLAAIVDRMLAGVKLTAGEKQHLANAEQVKSRILQSCQSKIDEEFGRALAVLTVDQLFSIVLRKRQLQDTWKSIEQIRTSSDEEWEKLRESLTHRLTDEEYFGVLSEAHRKWESETGKRTDLPGSGFSIKAAGIEDRLEGIRQKGRAYLQRIRDSGTPRDDLMVLAESLIGPAVRELRTWPPLGRYRHLRGTPDGVPIQKLMVYDGKPGSPFEAKTLLAGFLTALLVTPGAEKLLEKYGSSG